MDQMKSKWAMVPNLPFNIRATLNFLLIFIYVISYMFPNITKNLLSVQKFTYDDNVYMKFHPSCFFVKDRTSGKILHQESSRHGLYHWFSPTAAPPSIFFLANMLASWIGTLALATLLIALFVMSSINFNFQLPTIRSSFFARPVSEAKVISFLLICLKINQVSHLNLFFF
jgi:hypothetical protein